MGMAAGELTCRELVELVTDYLEDRLAASERRRFEDHLADCNGCTTYLNQMRRTIGLLRGLGEEALPPGSREALLGAFRDWKRTGAAGRADGMV